MYCASFLQLKTTYYSDLNGVTFDVDSLLYVQVNMECKNPSNRYIIRGFNSCQENSTQKNRYKRCLLWCYIYEFIALQQSRNLCGYTLFMISLKLQQYGSGFLALLREPRRPLLIIPLGKEFEVCCKFSLKSFVL